MVQNRNYKYIPAILVILTTVFLTILLLSLPEADFESKATFYRTSTVVLASFSLIILYSWIIIHQVIGLLSLIFATLITIFYSLLTGEFSFSFHILSYAALSTVSHYYLTQADEFRRMNEIKLEEYSENINSLSDSLSKSGVSEASLEKKKLRFASLKTFTEELSSTLNVDDVMEIIVDEAQSIIGKAEEAVFYMIGRNETELNLVTSRRPQDMKPIKAKKGDLYDNWVLRHRQPLLIEDTHRDFRFDINLDSKDVQMRSIIISPMIHKDKVMGILRLASTEVGSFFPDDLRLLNIITDLAAVSLENTQLYQRTVELAVTDSLTGLFVLRYFSERMEEELNRALRSSATMSLIILDVDFFKAYNDSFGHSAGDIALKAITRIMRRVTKAGDLIGRYGGEEFIIVLPGKTKKEAQVIAEKIRKEVNEHDFSIRRSPADLTVSLGVSSFPRDAKVSSELIQKADEALYQAKRKGRNKVCLASSL